MYFYPGTVPVDPTDFESVNEMSGYFGEGAAMTQEQNALYQTQGPERNLLYIQGESRPYIPQVQDPRPTSSQESSPPPGSSNPSITPGFMLESMSPPLRALDRPDALQGTVARASSQVQRVGEALKVERPQFPQVGEVVGRGHLKERKATRKADHPYMPSNLRKEKFKPRQVTDLEYHPGDRSPTAFPIGPGMLPAPPLFLIPRELADIGSHEGVSDVEARTLSKDVTQALVERTMSNMLDKKASYKTLLKLRGENAQHMLNIMQKLLDNQSLDRVLRRSVLVATLRLCGASAGYPECLTLQGVQRHDRPVTEGRFGEIWRGHFQGQDVCLKVVKLYQRSQVEHLIKNFAREAIMWSQLMHPDVLPFYGIYHLNDVFDRVCLVSPWMADGNISEYLKANPEAPRLPLIDDILVGLAHLHANSIIHGDLKGLNILITPTGSACLADFGLSSVVDDEILRWTSLETMGQAGGTLRWEAPELIEGTDDGKTPRPTFSSDVYSVGSVMYEVLTQRIPFYEFPRDSTVISKVIRGITPTKPSTDMELELSDEIWEVMQMCWSYAPKDRPTVEKIIEMLQQCPPNNLATMRIAQQRGKQTQSTLPVLTPLSFRAAMRGGNLNFSVADLDLLRDLVQQ